MWPRDPGIHAESGTNLCTIPDLDRLYPGEDNPVSLQGVIVVQTLSAVGLGEVDVTKIGVFNVKKPKCKCVFSISPPSCHPGSICIQASGSEYRFRREELCDRFSRFRVFCLCCSF